MQGGGQSQRTIEAFQPCNAFRSNGFVRTKIFRNVKDPNGKLAQLGDAALGENVFHPCGENDGQTRTVGDVIKGAQLVLQTVTGPVGDAACTQQTVVRQRGRPHDLGPRIVILRLLQCDRGVMDDGF